MLPRNVWNIKNEDGFSLIGFLITLAIMALITNGIMMAIFQIYDVSSNRTNQLLAIRDVQSAGRWLTLDARKAARIETTQDADGFPMTISWNASDGNEHDVVYTVLIDKTLQRQHYTNRTVNPNPDFTVLVARYLDPSQTLCSVTGDNELVTTITAAVDIDRVTYTETRTYRVFPRLSLY
ncbi:hypothetical protein ACFLV1_01750 [Chloroflexota bacterium]